MTGQIKELALTLARLTGIGKDEFAMKLVTENAIDVWADDLCCERGISTAQYVDFVCCGIADLSGIKTESICAFKHYQSRREAVTVCRLKALIKSYEVEK